MKKFANAIGNLYVYRDLYNWGGRHVTFLDLQFSNIIKRLVAGLGYDHALDTHVLIDEDYIRPLIQSLITDLNKKEVKRHIYEASVELQCLALRYLTPVSHALQFLSAEYLVTEINGIIANVDGLKLDPATVFVSVITTDKFITDLTNFEISVVRVGSTIRVELWRDGLCFAFELGDETDMKLPGGTFNFKIREGVLEFIDVCLVKP